MKTNYELILAQFDEALRAEIQDKCLYAVLDVAYKQGYAEGFRDGLNSAVYPDCRLKDLRNFDSQPTFDFAKKEDK